MKFTGSSKRDETIAFRFFIDWAFNRMRRMEAQLQSSTILSEVANMEAFAMLEHTDSSTE